MAGAGHKINIVLKEETKAFLPSELSNFSGAFSFPEGGISNGGKSDVKNFNREKKGAVHVTVVLTSRPEKRAQTSHANDKGGTKTTCLRAL